uniref:Rho GTPase activating protein 44 n=1 Tax=Iconisemion striatum TaxID=60296 RepID=A0A1A7XVR7_9TELE
MGVRVMDTSWVSRRGSSSTRKTCSTPPSVHPPTPPADALIPEQPGDFYASPSPTLPPTSSDRASTLKNKELSPVIGQKGLQGSMTSSGPSQHSEHSPHSLRRAKKLAPIPPKGPYCQTGAISDQSTGQPSPVSLSPTPPSTPSPYGFSYPQGYATIGSLSQIQTATTPSLSSPPSLAGTLTKPRPTPKPPRQRPSLPPPPQPPSTPGTSPQPLEVSSGLLDGLPPGESMSTAV